MGAITVLSALWESLLCVMCVDHEVLSASVVYDLIKTLPEEPC